jgi:hypothetical protein
VLNPAVIHWTNGLKLSLRGDRDEIAAAEFEEAIKEGLAHDDEMEARFALGEQYKQLVFNSGLGWQQCVDSQQFGHAMSQIGQALKMDCAEGYGYFADPLNRGRLKTFDLMCLLGADAILERGDRRGAITYLHEKVELCSYLASCPLLNVLLKVGTLYLEERRVDRARICFTSIVTAEPVDRVDEHGSERGIRDEARERIRTISK